VVNDEVTLSPPITVYPPRRWPGLNLEETWRMRSVCVVLTQRLLKARYRQAVVGAGWALLQPLLMMLAFTVFFGIFAKLPSEGVPYPLFFFSGLIVWQIISKQLAEGSGSVLANSTLVTRIYFPRVYFPVSVALSSVVDFGFNLIALAVLMLYYGWLPAAQIVLVPFILVLVYAASLGLTLWLAALDVAYRDVSVLVPFLVQVGFFLAPIIYPASIVPPEYQAIYFLNPFALGIEAFRWAVLGTPVPPDVGWIAGTAVGALLFISGYIFFRQREDTFADVI
jgi:lipopolysaccharide transport system permease protein